MLQAIGQIIQMILILQMLSNNNIFKVYKNKEAQLLKVYRF